MLCLTAHARGEKDAGSLAGDTYLLRRVSVLLREVDLELDGPPGELQLMMFPFAVPFKGHSEHVDIETIPDFETLTREIARHLERGEKLGSRSGVPLARLFYMYR